MLELRWGNQVNIPFSSLPILDIANDVAMEHYFISPSSYIETKTQPLFRNLGRGKKGLSCMIWEEDAMEQFESWIELSYLNGWQYVEEHDECSSEGDTNLARERLENLYDLHLFRSRHSSLHSSTSG